MKNYRKTAHTTYDLKYHIVWITKYRKQVLTGVIAEKCRDLLREVCKANDVEIIKGHVSKDHVHLFVSIPPSTAISRLLQFLKGKSSHKMMLSFAELRKQFWGQHLWARGYFVCSSGNITDEMIMEYIENQDIAENDEDFKIS